MRWVIALACLAGCPFEAPTPLARVRKGPAGGGLVSPVAALPATCQSPPQELSILGVTTPIDNPCSEAYELAIATATRMELEYAGYGIVDTELLNAEARTRVTRTTDWQSAYGSGESSTTEVTGLTWAQLSPGHQRDVLMAIGVRGLLSSTLTIGAARGLSWQQTVTVALSLTRVEDGVLAWRSQCSAETGDYRTLAVAIEVATRCALESTTLW
ncbi:MAG TPA: hypothetical protein VM734_12275 [Kofleriaceae bacterium]|nr:hypothetical protein [Kofleriaceae bacterium]